MGAILFLFFVFALCGRRKFEGYDMTLTTSSTYSRTNDRSIERAHTYLPTYLDGLRVVLRVDLLVLPGPSCGLWLWLCMCALDRRAKQEGKGGKYVAVMAVIFLLCSEQEYGSR